MILLILLLIFIIGGLAAFLFIHNKLELLQFDININQKYINENQKYINELSLQISELTLRLKKIEIIYWNENKGSNNNSVIDGAVIKTE